VRLLGSFHPLEIAEAFVSSRGPFAFVNGLAYRYSDATGAWRPVAQLDLLKDIQKMNYDRYYMEETKENKRDGTTTTKTKYLMMAPRAQNDVATCITRMTFPADKQFEANPGRGIAFPNGYVTVDKDGPKVVGNKPENYATANLPFQYDPHATAPYFEEMLNQLFRDDEDREAKKLALAQFYGACLFGRATKFERCFILLGGGSNGKSTFMEVMQDTLFQRTSRSVSPERWDHEYYIASLHGARLNTVSEIPSSDVFGSEKFKLVITGDEQTGRNPTEKPFSFRPLAGHVFSANEMPSTGDVNPGFWRRFLVVPFNRNFTGGKRENIKAPIIDGEAAGVLNWAIKGLVSALINGGYVIPDSHTMAMAEWKRTADAVVDFVESCCEKSETAPTSVAELYEEYKFWALNTGHRVMAAVTFGKRLTSAGVSKHKKASNTHYGIKVKARRYWADFKGGGETELKVVEKEKANGS